MSNKIQYAFKNLEPESLITSIDYLASSLLDGQSKIPPAKMEELATLALRAAIKAHETVMEEILGDDEDGPSFP